MAFMIDYVLWLSVKSPHTSVCPFCLFTFEIGQRSEASHSLGSDLMVDCISNNSAVLTMVSEGGRPVSGQFMCVTIIHRE